MKVVITGANGMLGRSLCAELSRRDIQVCGLVRDPARSDALKMLPQVFLEAADVTRSGPWQRSIDGADAVIHLAGPLLHSSPTQAQGRVLAAHEIVRACNEARKPPTSVLVASTVLAFGERNDQVDESSPPVRTPLSEAALEVEAVFTPLANKTRLVGMRFGQMLGNGGLLRAVKQASAVPEASPRPFSWISIADAVSAVAFALKSNDIHGVAVIANTRPTDVAQLRKALEPLFPKKGFFGGGPKTAKDLPLVSGVRARPTRILGLGGGFRDEALDKFIAKAM